MTFLINAQKATYISLSTGPKYDFWEYKGDINQLDTKPSFSIPFLRLSVERELLPKFRASIGVDINGHSFTTKFKAVSTLNAGITTIYTGVHIPLRAHYQFFELKNDRIKVRLLGHVGYQFAINTDYQSSSFSNTGFANGQSISTVFQNNKRTTFHLLEVGGRFEIEVFNRWVMLLGGHFAEGLNDVVNGTITYDIGDGNNRQATLISQGSYYIFEMGAQYRFGGV